MNILLLNPPFLPGQRQILPGKRGPTVTDGIFYYPMARPMPPACWKMRALTANLSMPLPPASPWTKSRIFHSAVRPEIIVVATSTPSIANDVATGRPAQGKIRCFYHPGGHPSLALPEEVLRSMRPSRMYHHPR